jgi:hypothetical protein
MLRADKFACFVMMVNLPAKPSLHSEDGAKIADNITCCYASRNWGGQRRFARPLAANRSTGIPEISEGQMEDFTRQAKDNLRASYPGIDLDTPGFQGLVQQEVRKLLRTMNGG